MRDNALEVVSIAAKINVLKQIPELELNLFPYMPLHCMTHDIWPSNSSWVKLSSLEAVMFALTKWWLIQSIFSVQKCRKLTENTHDISTMSSLLR